MDSEKVRAFRFARGTSGCVEVTWKRDAGLSEPWQGIDGPDSVGFIVLRSRPLTPPAVLPAAPANELEKKFELRGVYCAAIRRLCELHGTPEAPDFNKHIVETGEVPLGPAVDARDTYDGRLHRFGVDGSTATIRYVQ